MKQEIITPFVESFKDIFSQMGKINMKLENTYFKSEISSKDNILLVLGINGTIKGQVIIDFSEIIAKKAVSNIIEVNPIVIFDEIAKKCILELGDVIIGNAISKLYENGVNVEIVSPILIIGKELNLSFEKDKIYCIVFKSGEEKVELNILI